MRKHTRSWHLSKSHYGYQQNAHTPLYSTVQNKVRVRFSSRAMGVYSGDVQESQPLEMIDFVQLFQLLPATS